MQLNNRDYLKQFRKRLRNEMTPAEILLWCYLKNKQLEGFKFRRQHSIGNYIVDFYSAAKKLAIELDGGVHKDINVQAYDRRRTELLNTFGVSVIRFDNEEVMEDLEGVLEQIKKRMIK